MIERHGWTLFAHPLFLGQLDRLLAGVARARRSDPENWQGKADAKVLAAIAALVLDRIPREPLSAAFRQGNTLGKEHRHWLRAKFGGNRFRLFYRADTRAKVIVYAWVNDRDTLRTENDLAQVAGDGLVGGFSNLAQGGSFQSGFLAAGFSSAIGQEIHGTDYDNVVSASITGGIGSVLGGGKFANGAETGAFGYLFNRGAAGFRGTGPNTAEANDLFSSAWGAATDPGFWYSISPALDPIGWAVAGADEVVAGVEDIL